MAYTKPFLEFDYDVIFTTGSNRKGEGKEANLGETLTCSTFRPQNKL